MPSSVRTAETVRPSGTGSVPPMAISISRSPPSVVASAPSGSRSTAGRPTSWPDAAPARFSAAPLAMATLPSGATRSSPAGMAATTSEARAVVWRRARRWAR